MTNEKTSRTWREINLDAIKHNLGEVRKRINEHTMIMGVVKADAYGHCDTQVSRVMLECGVSMLAVAEINEAEKLRKSGINAPILILGPENFADIPKAIELSVTASVNNIDYARALSDEAKKLNKIARVHIKIDTGMTRVGFNTTDKSIEEITEIASFPNIYLEGIFTHFACSDCKDRTITDMQFKRFMDFVKKLESFGIEIPIKHVANSAAILRFPEYQLDMVRSGIISYGYSPLEKDIECDVSLIPAMTVKSRITRINVVPKKTSVSYGHTFTTEKETTKIATLPIGYADGLLRALSNKGFFTVSEKNVPIIGRICMDQCMIDVTSVNNIDIGDEVIIFGDGKNSTITADTVANMIGSISYEVLCLISHRVPYVFLKDGEIW